MKKYVGITIGPISRTLNSAVSTLQLWGTSYIFSYISELITKKLSNDNWKLISPYIEKKDNKNGIGTYPDRLYYEIDSKNIEDSERELKKIINDIYSEISCILYEEHIMKQEITEDDFLDYVKEYFYIYYVICEYSKNDIFYYLNKILDNMEYRIKAPTIEKYPFILEYTANKNMKVSKLFKKAFGNRNIEKVPSTTDIARGLWQAKDLTIKDDKYNGDERYKPLNYYALVRADGDSTGSVIKNIEDYTKVKDISKNIMKFSNAATEEIIKYEGFTFYAGGDDLMFIAPIAKVETKNNQIFIRDNVFQLIDRLNCKFNELVGSEFNNKSVSNKLSISFGVSIYYHKNPLYEALEDSANLLFVKAKNYKGGKYKEKNCVAIRLGTHSVADNLSTKGKNQDTLIIMGMNEDINKTWKEFLKIMNIREFYKGTDKSELRMSYQGKFFSYMKIISHLLNVSEDKHENLDAWLNNNFQDEKGKWHFEAVKNLLESIYREKKAREIADDNFKLSELTVLDTVSILKIARFMREMEVPDNE